MINIFVRKMNNSFSFYFSFICYLHQCIVLLCQLFSGRCTVASPFYVYFIILKLLSHDRDFEWQSVVKWLLDWICIVLCAYYLLTILFLLKLQSSTVLVGLLNSCVQLSGEKLKPTNSVWNTNRTSMYWLVFY